MSGWVRPRVDRCRCRRLMREDVAMTTTFRSIQHAGAFPIQRRPRAPLMTT